MKNKRTSTLVAAVMILTSFVPVEAANGYHLLREIPVTGDGGWDYLSVDSAMRRLYVTHGTKVVVIDLDHDAVVGEIEGLSGVHGFAVASKLGYGFASNGKDNSVSTIDLATLKTVRKSPTGQNPDAVLFEPTRSEVYAFNGRSHSVTVIAASSGDVVATLPLTGKPEFSQTDGTTIFANIEDMNQVTTINPVTHAVAKPWSITPGEEPTGMELDRDHHRLFVGCGNEQLVVLDSQNGHSIANVRAGKGIDAVGFDAATQLIFTSNGEDGTVTIIHEDTPDKFSVVQTLTTERGARTLAVDPQSHHLYLTSAKFEAAAAGTGKRPALVPGTVKVLVYGRE
jgi:DNA-binding beta-propeller fold protein YncE